jgi:hypothetical protein
LFDELRQLFSDGDEIKRKLPGAAEGGIPALEKVMKFTFWKNHSANLLST